MQSGDMKILCDPNKVLGHKFVLLNWLGSNVHVLINQRCVVRFGRTKHGSFSNTVTYTRRIYHFRDLPTDSQTTDIAHFAVVFNYDVTIEALEILRSTAKCL